MFYVLGKFIEQVRHHMNCRLVLTDKKMRQYLNDPLFKKFEILDENVAFAFMGKEKIFLNKCYPIGFAILDISKYFMYDSWYSQIRKIFPSANLIMVCMLL